MFLKPSPDSRSLVMVAVKYGHSPPSPELHCCAELANCVANGQAPHQEPEVMVAHLHNTAAEQILQGFLLEKPTRLAAHTGRKTYDLSNLRIFIVRPCKPLI